MGMECFRHWRFRISARATRSCFVACCFLFAGSVSESAAQGWNVEVVGQIGGACRAVFVDGNAAYIGEGPNLRILDVSQPDAPVRRGRVPVQHTVEDVFVQNNRAYMALGAGGLAIADVSSSTSPQLLGTSLYSPNSLARAVSARGDHVYIADPNNGIQIIDASVPASPTAVATMALPGPPNDLATSGNLLFVTNNNPGLMVFDLGDPTSPALIGQYNALFAFRGFGRRGSLLYVSSGVAGFVVLDLSDPTLPTWVSAYNTPGVARDAAAWGDRVFVADTNDGLTIYKGNDPRFLEIDTTLSPAALGARNPVIEVFAVDDRTYIPDESGGLLIYDFINGGPIPLGFQPTLASAFDVYSSGGLAYVSDRETGLHIVDVSNPASPIARGFQQMPDEAFEVALAGQLAGVANGNRGLQLVNVANPDAPAIITACNTPGFAEYFQFSNDLAYIGDGAGGLQIVDIGNPTTPLPIGAYTDLDAAGDVFVDGNVAYLDGGSSGLAVVDVAVTTAPLLLGLLPDGGGTGIHHDSGLVYSSNWGRGLRVVDVVDPGSPTLLGTFGRVDGPVDTVTSGGIAYTAHFDGVKLLDVTRPAMPTPVGYFDLPASMDKVHIADGLIYAPDGPGGLWILRYTGFATSAPPGAPSNVRASDGVYVDAAEVTWDAPAGAGECCVYRSETTTGTPTAVSPWIVASKFRDTSAEPGLKYYYWIRARNTFGEGAFSLPELGWRRLPYAWNLEPRGQYEGAGAAWDVDVVGNLVYLTGDGMGLHVIDVTDPTSPTLYGIDGGWPGSFALDVVGDRAYQTGYSPVPHMTIMDVSDPSSPTMIVEFYPDPGFYSREVAAEGNLACLAGGDLMVVDVSVPTTPVVLARYTPPAGWARAVKLIGNLAYVATGAGGIEIVDLSNPASPVLRGSLITPGSANDLEVENGVAYIADDRKGLTIVDVSNPDMPAFLGFSDLGDNASYIHTVEGWAFVSDQQLGVQIIDSTNPTSPLLRATYDTPGWPNPYDLVARDEFVFVADGSAGLTIYEYTGPPSAPSSVTASQGLFAGLVQVTWNTSKFATEYCVYRADISSGPLVPVSGWITATTFDDTTAAVGVFYEYQVKARRASRESEFSVPATGWRAGTPPSAPNSVAASDGDFADRVQINWAPSPAATEYLVLRSTDTGGVKTPISGWTTATTCADTTSEVGTTFTYWVKARNEWGESGFSLPDSGWRRGLPPLPPENFAASDGTFPDRIVVTWDAATSASEYRVFRRPLGSGPSVAVSPWQSSTVFDDDTATTGVYYLFTVKARNEWGESGDSEPDLGWLQLPPSTAVRRVWPFYR